MSGQTSAVDPPIDRVASNAQVPGGFLDRVPAFVHRTFTAALDLKMPAMI